MNAKIKRSKKQGRPYGAPAPKRAAPPRRRERIQGDNGDNLRPEPPREGRPARKATPSDFRYFPPERHSLWPTEFTAAAFRPLRLTPRNWREEWPHMLAVFLVVLGLYAYTTPRLVTLEDDGLFIGNLHYFGVAHPPGYPMHTFLGGIFYHLLGFLNISTPAFRGHFFSGFAGAVACAAIYAAVIQLARGRVFAYLAGIAYGASRTFWSQAIIAEVYTLNAMFFFIVLAMCIRYGGHLGRATKSHARLFVLIAFFYGLGLATHYPILGLGSIGLGMMVLSQLKNIIPRIPLGGIVLAAATLPPYGWMVWRSQSGTPANFYGPIEDFDQFLFYVLRKGYSGVDTQEHVGLADKIVFAKSLGDDMLWQFTPLGFFFVVVGFVMMARSRHNWLWFSLTVSWFMSSVLLIYLLDFKAEFIWLAAFRVYHLLAFGIMAIWLALGAAWCVDLLRRWMSARALAHVGALAGALVVVGSVAAHWEQNNRKDYRWAHDLGMARINSVEQGAALFTFDDLDLPVGYLHWVEGVRPDLEVFNDQGLVYGNRLYPPLIPDNPPQGRPDVRSKAGDLRKYQEEAERSGRPVYYHAQRRDLFAHPRFGSDFLGFFRRVNFQGPHDRVLLSDHLIKWLDENVRPDLKITDRWTRQQHYTTVATLVNAIVLAGQHGFDLDDKWEEVIDRARLNNALTRIITDDQYLRGRTMERAQMREELRWTQTYGINEDTILDRAMRAHFYLLGARIAAELYGEGEDAPCPSDVSRCNFSTYEEALRGALASVPGEGNPALSPALDYYFREERYCDFIALVEKTYPSADKIPAPHLRRLRQARRQGGCGSAAADGGDDA